MSDKDSFYYLNAYQDGITPGQQVTIQHRISFNDWRAGPHIAPLVGLAGEEIMRRKEASIALEKDLYAQLKKLAEAWDEQAAQTMLLERALEYVHTPEVAHTSNEWKEGENGVWEISNRTYIMRYRISYEKAADSYLVSWGIVYNAPKQPDPKYTNYWGDSIYVARQDRQKLQAQEQSEHQPDCKDKQNKCGESKKYLLQDRHSKNLLYLVLLLSHTSKIVSKNRKINQFRRNAAQFETHFDSRKEQPNIRHEAVSNHLCRSSMAI